MCVPSGVLTCNTASKEWVIQPKPKPGRKPKKDATPVKDTEEVRASTPNYLHSAHPTTIRLTARVGGYKIGATLSQLSRRILTSGYFMQGCPTCLPRAEAVPTCGTASPCPVLRARGDRTQCCPAKHCQETQGREREPAPGEYPAQGEDLENRTRTRTSGRQAKMER